MILIIYFFYFFRKKCVKILRVFCEKKRKKKKRLFVLDVDNSQKEIFQKVSTHQTRKSTVLGGSN
jgi:hypothetical protein